MSPETSSEFTDNNETDKVSNIGRVVASTILLMHRANKQDNGEVSADKYDPSSDAETDPRQLNT